MISARRLGAAGAFVAVAACALALPACVETRRTLGEDCLKNVDCLSGICSGLRCAAAPPILDGAPDNVVDAAPADAGDASDGATPIDSASGDADEGG
jgi:hypothetical protein